MWGVAVGMYGRAGWAECPGVGVGVGGRRTDMHLHLPLLQPCLLVEQQAIQACHLCVQQVAKLHALCGDLQLSGAGTASQHGGACGTH